jgi:hypothetical protein
MPDEPLQFRCYALFLNPAKALIIKAKDPKPVHDQNGNNDASELVPRTNLTTET